MQRLVFVHGINDLTVFHYDSLSQVAGDLQIPARSRPGWAINGVDTSVIQVSVLTIDTTATPPAPAEPFGVAHASVVKGPRGKG